MKPASSSYVMTDITPLGAVDPPKSISDLIETVFAVVEASPNVSWARTFLFGTSTESIAEILFSSAALRESVTARISDTCFRRPDYPKGSAFVPELEAKSTAASAAYDRCLAIDILLIPAFSANGLSVGAVVERVASAPARSPSMIPAFTHAIGRFVRDESTNELLMVKSLAPPDGSAAQTHVVSLRLSSTRRRERIYLICDDATFREDRDISNSVQLALHANEARFCVSCGASPAQHCECAVPISRSEHPFDFRCHYAGICAQNGKYIGYATATVAEGEECHDPTPLISHVSMECWNARQPGMDDVHAKICAPLRSFAFHFFSALKCSAGGFSLPQTEEHLGRSFTREFTVNLDTGFDALDDYIIDNSGQKSVRSMFESIAKLEKPQPAEMFDPLHTLCQISGNDERADLGIDSNFGLDFILEMKTDPENSLLDASLGSYFIEPLPNATVNPSSAANPLSLSSFPASSAEVLKVVAASSDSSGACGPSSISNTYLPSSGRCLADQRRERNRTSAAVSNARRKAKNDSLKDAVAEVRSLIVKLRSRQEGLRSENRILRKLADRASGAA
jgi:hypothetical protein